jgi:hypothetical protein
MVERPILGVVILNFILPPKNLDRLNIQKVFESFHIEMVSKEVIHQLNGFCLSDSKLLLQILCAEH